MYTSMDRRSLLLLLFVSVVLVFRVSLASDGTKETSIHSSASSDIQTIQSHDTNGVSDEVKKFVEFTRSNYYVRSFEDEIITMPNVQREFVITMMAKDMDLLRTIAKEAIEKRNNFAPSVALIFKYSGKLLGNFIRNRQAEMRLSSRKEPKSSFWEMLARTAETVIDRSTVIKKEKGYSKKTIDVEDLYRRLDNVLKYVLSVTEASPVAAYLKWDELILYKNDNSNPLHDTPLIEEAADLTAQFRAMGYDSCTFVARRIINLLRMFSRGFIPSEKEV